MAETPSTQSPIENLRECIKKLDQVQAKAILADDLPMSKQEIQDCEECSKLISGLKRELLTLTQRA